jgi:hypothetical protein
LKPPANNIIDFTRRSNWKYNLGRALEGIASVKEKAIVNLYSPDVESFLSAQYSFKDAEGRVGEACKSQLVLSSNAFPSSTAVILSQVEILYEGNIKPIVLEHDTDQKEPENEKFGLVYKELTLAEKDDRAGSVGKTNLELWPGQRKIFEFASLLREAGSARAVSAAITMTTESFDVKYVHVFDSSTRNGWWSGTSTKPTMRNIVRLDPCTINVLPKPPKVELNFFEDGKNFYTNENIILKLEVRNGEDEDVIAGLDVELIGDDAPQPTVHIVSTNGEAVPNDTSIPGHLELGTIPVSQPTYVNIIISSVLVPSTYDMKLVVKYTLKSDSETSISRSLSSQIPIICPFESNYDFVPRLHPDLWPSYFSPESILEIEPQKSVEDSPNGLSQRWALTARYASFATEELFIHSISIAPIALNGAITCKIHEPTQSDKVVISPSTLEESTFTLDVQKISLEDRRIASLDLSLVINWTRSSDDEEINSTTLPMPRFLVCSSEPRVLASLSPSPTSLSEVNASIIHLVYTIENPSMHFLTFGFSMEASETFAFSGPKLGSVQLLPLSRTQVSFKLLPSVRGEWIYPSFVVRDRYFQKVLRVLPGDGMRVDKKGIAAWVPVEDDV